MNPQFIEFQTADGLTFPGLFYQAEKSKKVAIYLHGNGSSSVFYNHNEKREFAEVFVKNGISFLYFNNRGAHIIKSFRTVTNGIEERKNYGTAFEVIKECVEDIDGAINFLKNLGYDEFYLMGHSTGANKICVYHHYKPKNKISNYILLAGGDDTGIYYDSIGKSKFWALLEKAKEKIDRGEGDQLMKELLPEETFAYTGFYDIANPDGDYNCFPFYEAINKIKLSEEPLFRYFKEINKPSLVIYGDLDEYAWGNITRVVDILKKQNPKLDYQIIKDANHGFDGKKKELGEKIIEWLKT